MMTSIQVTAASPTQPSVKPVKQSRDRINGILLFDKPRGLSSNGAMMAVRRLLAAAKAGHGGTLDPMATGLLPLLVGEATKFAHDLLDADKTYLAEMKLGEQTDTGDVEGEVISRREVTCTIEQVHEACAAFVGGIEQIPPMYSALKRDGKPLYEYARAGQTVERAARAVTIFSLDVIEVALPTVIIRVRCSKGTYIRTLAEDIGNALGCGAHLTALRREAVASLTLASAVTMATLEAQPLSDRRGHLLSIDSLLAGLQRVDLPTDLAARFTNGQRIRLDAGQDGAEPSEPKQSTPRTGDAVQRVRVYSGEQLLGIASLVQGLLAPLRLISTETSQ